VKINLYKSKVICFGKVKEVEDQYRELFACGSRSIAFRYIGTSAEPGGTNRGHGSPQHLANFLIPLDLLEQSVVYVILCPSLIV
jgi:hypothetical protein